MEETLKYPAAYPGPVGIVIDENTGLVVKGSVAKVLGAWSVVLVDPVKDKRKPYLELKAGNARGLAK